MRFISSILLVLLVGIQSHGSTKKNVTDIQKFNRAIELEQSQIINSFLKKKKFNFNQKGDEGMTPLMTAASSGNLLVTESLLKKKVTLEEKNNIGDTALGIAVSAEQTEIAKKLIQAGAQVDITVFGENADTILIAAAKSSLDLVKAILSKAPPIINQTNKVGNTALMEAARTGYNDVVAFLISKGANKSLKNNDGKSALDLAKENYNKKGIELLSKK